MASQTKAEILRQHQSNTDLNTPIPAQIMRGQNDLSADGLIRPLDERIIAATADALESGETHYVDVPGIPPLRQALAEFLNDFAAAPYRQGNIVVTAGMQEARFLSIQMIGAQFDNIGVPEVVHPGARKALATRARNVVSLPVDADAGCLPSLDSISAALAGGCQLLFLESPSRLSGAVYSADQVAAISQALVEHDAAAIWDQGLAVWLADGYASLAAHDSEAERVAAIGEAFPGLGLASWFIGYIAAPEAWVPPMQSQKQIMSICTSTASPIRRPRSQPALHSRRHSPTGIALRPARPRRPTRWRIQLAARSRRRRQHHRPAPPPNGVAAALVETARRRL